MQSAPSIDWKKYRKRLLVNPRFQYSFLRYFLGIAGATLALFYAAKVFFFIAVRRYITQLGFPPDHSLFDFLARQSLLMDGLFAAAAIAECALLLWMGLKISNRVAGPLYRLRSELLRTAQGGEVMQLKFRDGDYFNDLADAYNTHMSEIQKRSKAA